MKKGSHIPKSKVSLNDLEKGLLEYLLEPLDEGCSFTATSLQIDEMLKGTKLIKNKKWTHHSTTETLSNLVGMDLVEELVGYYSEEMDGVMKINNVTPVYTIEYNSVFHNRANYARDRDNTRGISLFHIIKGDEKFGEGLWPSRPTDRVQYTGTVMLVSGIPQVTYKYRPDDLRDMLGKEVKITIQS